MAEAWGNDPLVEDWGNDPLVANPEAGSATTNFASHVAQAPGAVIGAPRAVLNDLPNWLAAKASNLVTGGDMTGADVQKEVDKHSSVLDPSRLLPSSGDVDNVIFGGLSKLAGHEVKPYEPQTFWGRLGGAATTGFTAGLFNPSGWLAALKSAPELAGSVLAPAAKVGFAATAGQGAHELDPDSDVLPVAAAILAHSSAGLVPKGIKSVYPAVRQWVDPKGTGTDIAAAVGSDPQVSNASGTAPASPTAMDLLHAQEATQRNTGAWGPGESAAIAGGDIKNDLLNRQADLIQSRKELTQPFADARDASTSPVDIKPVIQTINDKLETAAGDQRNAILRARGNLQMPPTAAPAFPGQTFRSQADQLAASRNAISSQIDDAMGKTIPDKETASHLLDIRNALDKQIEGAVPEAKTAKDLYAAASRPLDPFNADKNTVSAVPDVVAKNQFGEPVVGTPNSEIPDTFLRGNATKEKLDQLVEAHGGDKAAALTSLEQFLIGKAQSAVKDDGTLDSAAFGKAMTPYNLDGNFAMRFPKLAAKFNSTEAAQATLDRVNGQAKIAADIASPDGNGNGGGLRDMSMKGGQVTRASVQSWLAKNDELLKATQTPEAHIRIKQIANAMPNDPLQTGKNIQTGVPIGGAALIGGGMGNALALAGSQLGRLITSIPDRTLMEAYSKTIEKIFADPEAANQLGQELSARKGGLSASTKFKDAFESELGKAIAVAPITTAPARNGP